MLLSWMDDIDISVSGADMMNSSQMMQALTMFQSFYGEREHRTASDSIRLMSKLCRKELTPKWQMKWRETV